MMKKMVMAVAFVAVASMAAAVETAQEIPAPEPILAQPVRAAEAAEPEKPATPAEKLALSKGITVEEAREILLAAGLDPDARPLSDAEAAGFDGEEKVEVNYTQAWVREPGSQRLISIYQGTGRFSKGDRQYLFANGRRILPVTDINGHSDGSSVIGQAFGTEKRIVSGLMVASTRTAYAYTAYKKDKKGNLVKDKKGNLIPVNPVKVWLNLCIDARKGAYVRECQGVWNLREGFDPSTASFQEMEPEEWLYEEKSYGASVSPKGDPSYFALVVLEEGAHVSIAELVDKCLIEGKFDTLSAGLLPKPVFTKGIPLRVLNKDGSKKR